jgi:hypothetical protein
MFARDGGRIGPTHQQFHQCGRNERPDDSEDYADRELHLTIAQQAKEQGQDYTQHTADHRRSCCKAWNHP